MADVFISYAHEDQSFVRQLVPALEAEGLSVWWDHTIPPGKTWDEVIARGIQDAKACIIIWSPHSVASDWVKEEATLAKDGGKYLPVQIGVEPPMGFRRIQAANLTGWTGDVKNQQWIMLAREAANLAGVQPAKPQPAPPVTPAPSTTVEPAKKSGGGGLVLTLAAVALVGVGAWYLGSHGRDAPAPAAIEATAPATAAPTALTADPLTGNWRFETVKSSGQCHLAGSLVVGDPATPRACKISAQWICPSFTQFAEESCALTADGDAVKISSTLISYRSNDNEKRDYWADNFKVTVSGSELKGTLDSNVSMPVTFTKQP